MLAVGTVTFRSPVHGLHHPGEGAVPVADVPLCKLSSVHVKTLNKLQLKMTELYPDIKYIKGKNNVVVNFLSRYQGMNIHVMDVKYDEGRVNAAVAALSHKDFGPPVQMVDASTIQSANPAEHGQRPHAD
jgi:hypothetical protein